MSNIQARPLSRDCAQLWEVLSAILPDGSEYVVSNGDLDGLVAFNRNEDVTDAFRILSEGGYIALKPGSGGNRRRVRILSRAPVSSSMRAQVDYYRVQKEKPVARRKCNRCRRMFQPEHRTNFRCETCTSVLRGQDISDGLWMGRSV